MPSFVRWKVLPSFTSHLFLYESHNFPCENRSYCTFSLSVTLFWTCEQKAQMRWTANKGSDQCSVQTTRDYCEVQNDKPSFWQYQIQNSWLPQLGTNSNGKKRHILQVERTVWRHQKMKWNHFCTATCSSWGAEQVDKVNTGSGKKTIFFPSLLHIIFVLVFLFCFVFFFFHGL